MSELHTRHPIDAFGIEKVSMSGIRIERLEDRIDPRVPFPHKHDFFQIVVITSGSGNHQIDFIDHRISPGQIYLMKPGQMHSWKLSKGVRGFVVEFSFESLSSISESPALIHELSFMPDVLSTASPEIGRLCEIMRKESGEKRDRHDLNLQCSVVSLLIQLSRLSGPIRTEKTHPLIEKFRALLEKHYRSQHAVEFYAKKLNTTPKALTMQLTRSIGRPPRDIIFERILLEAKRYLAFSDLSVAEVGYALGFEDANYFGRFFRTHVGQTPAKFRTAAEVPR